VFGRCVRFQAQLDPVDKEATLAKVRIGLGVSKITSKYQVTVPKVIAEKYGLRPGDEIAWIASGEVIRVIPPTQQVLAEDRDSRLRLFDQATERNRRAEKRKGAPPRERGWARQDLYARGRSR
jgi:AbrB family looped-hinge helix DNA binding protein